MSAAFVAIKDPVEVRTLTGSRLLTCGLVIIPGPFSDRQKCWDGSEKKLEWKRTSPQIWQRWAFVRSIFWFGESGGLSDVADDLVTFWIWIFTARSIRESMVLILVVLILFGYKKVDWSSLISDCPVVHGR